MNLNYIVVNDSQVLGAFPDAESAALFISASNLTSTARLLTAEEAQRLPTEQQEYMVCEVRDCPGFGTPHSPITPTTIVVTGNPIDGFTFYGPFDVRDDATEWIETVNDDCWLADLNPVVVTP
jgi:hypothetical protein